MSFKTSFQWFADYNTSTSGMQIIQFSAGGNIVRQRLAPMFAHYRKYKLGAIHVKFVPAATLPVDPTGLSYEEGEQTVDPRDMFNPGLVRHTNGEDVMIPPEDYLDSEASDNLYYSTMLDKRWHKFRLQRGITLRAFPKFWGVANLRQNMFPGMENNVPMYSNVTNILTGETVNYTPYGTAVGTGKTMTSVSGSSDMSLFQTGQRIPMGWMPTGASLKDEYGLLNGLGNSETPVQIGVQYTVVGNGGTVEMPVVQTATFDSLAEAQQWGAEFEATYPNATTTITTTAKTIEAGKLDAGAAFAPVPEIPGLLTLVLPRSRKTQFYYRVYVKEDVYFADPVTSFNAINNGAGGFMRPMDVFTHASISPLSPAKPEHWIENPYGNEPTNDGDA